MKQLKKSSFLVLTIGFGLILLGSSIPAMAGVHLIAVIPVPGRPLTSFDISWVDAPTQTYFLADRSNFGVDMFNSDDNTFIGRLGGFVGPSTSTDTAGPNGLLEIHGFSDFRHRHGHSNRHSSEITRPRSRGVDLIATPAGDRMFLRGSRQR